MISCVPSVCLCSAGNMESLSAGSLLSSMRLYMIIRASAGYGWVKSCVLCLYALIIEPAFSVMLQGVTSAPSVIVILICGAKSLWHQTQCSDYLCTPTLLRKWEEDSVMCVIKSLLIVTPLHVFFILRQKMEAAYYDNIIEQQRIEPEFFRMGFYGRKFPFFLRVRLTQSDLILSVLTQLLLCWWGLLHCSFMLQQETMSAAAVCARPQAFVENETK